MLTSSIEFDLPDWTAPIFDNHTQYIIYHGGRGGGKSYNVAKAVIIRSLLKKTKILCGREVLGSIRHSVHATIKEVIEACGLESLFRITIDSIFCKSNGSQFIFKGLEKNVTNIKSIPGIDILWIEEAASLSYRSWSLIEPTIRSDNAKIIMTFNPQYKSDCVYQEFIVNKPNNAFVHKITWLDNPYHSKTAENTRLKHLAEKTPDEYRNIWEGEVIENSAAQVFFNKWKIQEFDDPDKIYAYIGLDFGYSVDPTAAIRCYIHDNKLYISHEVYEKNLEIDKIGKICEEKIPGFKVGPVIADSSQPGTISFIKRQNYVIRAAEKGKGSIEDGIAYIRSFDNIIIHPRCKNTINEFSLYSYKRDKHSNEITTDIIDAHNHAIDAIRYALERCLKKSRVDYKILNKW